MTTTYLPAYRTLANGIVLALADEARRTYAPARCPWLVQIASDNPEPDSIEDCYRIVPCDRPLVEATDTYWACEAGHSHASYDDPRRSGQDLADMAADYEASFS